MFGSSIVAMTLIDIAHVAVAVYLLWLFQRHKPTLTQVGAVSAMRLIVLGLCVVAGFHLFDLATMYIIPHFYDRAFGMQLMRSLHLNWSWISTGISVILIAAGVTYLMRVLLPQATISMRALEELADAREQELTAAKQQLEVEHNELKELSERYSLAVAGSEAGIWETEQPMTPERGRSWWSDDYLELLDLKDCTGVDIAWRRRIHPDDECRVLKALETHLRDRTPFDEECRLRLCNGEYRWFHLSGRARWNAAGEVLHMAGSIRNVTEQRNTAHRMRELDIAIENAMTGVARLDTDGMFVEVRSAYAEMLGYDDPSELVGRPWTVTVAADDIDAGRLGYMQMLEVGRAQARLRAVRKDGSEFIKELLLVKIVNDDDEHDGHYCFMRDVTTEHALSQQLSHQAMHDSLTGLINRTELETRLERALDSVRSEDREHALLYLDLDQFKVINDTCGHSAGDQLLRQLGQVLIAQVRSGDTVARLGGDEFGILLENCSEAQAMRIAAGLRSAVQEFTFVWDGKTFSLGASIGLVAITAQSGTLSDIMKDVDSACYAAKEDGRNRIHLHRPDDARISALHGEMQWVSKINSALADERLVLYRQPLISVNERRAAGARFEILIRLRDENGRLVSPGAFLPAAERYGLMPRIDRWVIATTIEWLKVYAHEEQVDLCHINVSGASLAGEHFLDDVLDLLERSGVSPEILCFEITETAAISNMSHAHAFIDALRERGCQFALDDFGSGLSSFGYLKNLPIDFVKIDGVFVRDILNDPIDLAMVKAIHNVTKVLGKSSIAEFVETEESLAVLREIGVDFAQGYWLGRPEPLPMDNMSSSDDGDDCVTRPRLEVVTSSTSGTA